jgi:hypothetical protein
MTYELIAQPDADKDRNDCARNRDDSAKHNLFHQMCSGGYASINPFGNPDQLGRAQDLQAIRRASSLDGRLEKVRRVFAVHPA